MRFPALLKKELRECLPLAAGAGLFLLVIGGIQLWTRPVLVDARYGYPVIQALSQIRPQDLAHGYFSNWGSLIMWVASILGVALALRQFWAEHYIKSWPFLLHRSASRLTILGVKIASGVLSLAIGVGAVWTVLFYFILGGSHFVAELPIRNLAEGWLFAAFGVVVYLGAAWAGLSKARWYTTKLLGLAFVLWILTLLENESQFRWFVVVTVAGAAVLICLITNAVLSREY